MIEFFFNPFKSRFSEWMKKLQNLLYKPEVIFIVDDRKFGIILNENSLNFY